MLENLIAQIIEGIVGCKARKMGFFLHNSCDSVSLCFVVGFLSSLWVFVIKFGTKFACILQIIKKEKK